MFSLLFYFIYSLYKLNKFIIWCDFVENRFSTFFAFMLNHPTFVFFMIDSHRHHKSSAFARTISGEIFIKMFGKKTKRAMVTRASLWVFFYVLSAIFANKTFINHFKRHKNTIQKILNRIIWFFLKNKIF